MKRFIELPRQLRGAEIRASSFNEERNTIDVVWTTGATVRRYSWREGKYYDERLIVDPASVRLGRLNSGAPLLDTHADYELENVLGSVEPGTARIESGIGLATVRLSNAPGDADIVMKIRDGIIRNISVGYMIHRVEKIEADDDTVPTWNVTDWEPTELSAVPVPADAGAHFRSHGSKSERDAPLFRAVMLDNTPEHHVRRARMAMTARVAGL